MNVASNAWQNGIIPARLAHLAIYSPSLGTTDETFDQQLVFYCSLAEARGKPSQQKSSIQRAEAQPREHDEALRQIGLAQGLINFAKTFSDDAPVSTIETERSRIVLHELEPGWWIYASIDLTRIPKPNSEELSSGASVKQKPSAKHSVEEKRVEYEYSSREVAPASLLVQQIDQAHTIFTLHHGPSLTSLYSKLPRDRFCGLLDRFWTRFGKTWDVLLHGNPAVDLLSGIKLASGGELGFGVGEEEWGSGEREVLENLTRQTDGLVDTIVARFGDQSSASESKSHEKDHDFLPWIGSGTQPSAADGIIFGGIDNISASSLRSISFWMSHLYTYGDHAYGVRDNPSRDKRNKRRRAPADSVAAVPTTPNQKANRNDDRQAQAATDDHMSADSRINAIKHSELPVRPGIPPPIVSATEIALSEATRKVEMHANSAAESRNGSEKDATHATFGIPDQYLKYLTFGLSNAFAKSPARSERESSPSKSATKTTPRSTSPAMKDLRETKAITELDERQLDERKMSILDPMPDGEVFNTKVAIQKRQEDCGHFIIGWKGDLDSEMDDDAAAVEEDSANEEVHGHRNVLRTVHVELAARSNKTGDNDSDTTIGSTPARQEVRLRVLIYAHRPFIYCFLFDLHTSSLGYPSFFRSLHRNLLPVHKALLHSTRESVVAQRLASVMGPLSKKHDALSPDPYDAPIYDLLYDPLRMTVHASLPNIPDSGTLAAEALSLDQSKQVAWSRLEALSVHSAVLHTIEATMRRNHELEQVSKTGRGWWIVWMKMPAAGQAEEKDYSSANCPIAFIVRKVNDAATSHKSSAGSRAVSGMWNTLTLQARPDTETQMQEKTSGLTASGVGFDARKYVETLLSLNR